MANDNPFLSIVLTEDAFDEKNLNLNALQCNSCLPGKGKE